MRRVCSPLKEATRTSVAYLKFRSQDVLYDFHKEFNGRVFADEQGMSMRLLAFIRRCALCCRH